MRVSAAAQISCPESGACRKIHRRPPLSRAPTTVPEVRPGWRGPWRLSGAIPRILAAGAILLLTASRLPAGLVVDFDGVRLPVQLRHEHPYVPLAGYASARFLEHEYSLVEDVYAIRAPSPEGPERVLAFRAGVAEVRVDGVARPLAAAPYEAGEGLLVPLRDLASLVLPAEALAHLALRPEGGATASLAAWEARIRPGQTKLLLTWEGSPAHRLEHRPESGNVEVVFDGARLGPAPNRLELTGDIPSSARLEENPGLLQVRLVVPVPAGIPVSADGFFLGRSSQYVLDLRTGGATATAGTGAGVPLLDPEETAMVSQFRVALDPGHGGGDRGATGAGGIDEKQLALRVARDLGDRLRASGVGVDLSRTDDRPLPMRTRIHILNRTRPQAVISFHARSTGPGEASTAPILALLPPRGVAGQVPGPLAPSPTELAAAERLAAELSEAFRRSLGVPAIVLRDPGLLPSRRVLAPSVVLDLGPLDGLVAGSDPGSHGVTPLEKIVQACQAGILRFLLALAKELPGAGGPRAGDGPSRIPPPPGSGIPEDPGYRDDVLGSPEIAPEEAGELPPGLFGAGRDRGSR